MKLNRQPIVNTTSTVATRSVKASRWVYRNQLEIGMYVQELDRPWDQTSFLFQGFLIDSPELLKQVAESCEQAYVQTEKQALVSYTRFDHQQRGLVRNR